MEYDDTYHGLMILLFIHRNYITMERSRYFHPGTCKEVLLIGMFCLLLLMTLRLSGLRSFPLMIKVILHSSVVRYFYLKIHLLFKCSTGVFQGKV